MIGVGLDSRLGLPFDELRAAAREAERLGFESLWTPAGGVPDSFHVCGLVAGHPAAHRDFRRPGGADVDPTEPGCPGGHGGSAVLGAVRARPRHGRLRAGVLGVGGPARPPDRGDARVRHRGLRAAGRRAGHRRPDRPRRRREPGCPGWPRAASLGVADLPPAPVYLAALGPQMLRLAGETADGALLNWATPERIAVSRARIDEGAARAGRAPGSVPMTMYIRVCVDDGAAGVRHAGARLCPGPPRRPGKRRLPGPVRPDGVRRGTDRARAAAGPGRGHAGAGGRGPRRDAARGRLLRPAAAAPAAFARLSAGLDEATVRIITARPGLQPVVETMEALTPALIRSWL